ncbi:MAG: PE-PPE domain-containing protein [Mycobacterium sp.]
MGVAVPAQAADTLLPGAANATVIYVPPTAPHPWSAGTIDLGAFGPEFASLIGDATQAWQVGYAGSLAPFTGPGNTLALNVSVAQGQDGLNAKIVGAPSGTQFIVFGESQGGIVMTAEALALMQAGSTADITWVRVADESTPYGLMGRNVGLLLPGASCILSPAESRWNQVIVKVQYDGFADWPVNEWNLVSDINALAGIVLYHGSSRYSVDLSTLPASDVTTTVNKYGATTTVYSIPSPGLLPALQLLQNAGVSAKVINFLQPILKPIVDAGYQQMTIPVLSALAQKTFVAAVNGAVSAGVWTLNSLASTRTTLTAAAASFTGMLRAASARLPHPAPTSSVPRTATALATTTATPHVPVTQAKHETVTSKVAVDKHQRITPNSASDKPADGTTKATPKHAKAHQ